MWKADVDVRHSANTTFEIMSWDEEAYDGDEEGRRLTRARVVRAYEGELEGEGRTEYLMMYREDGAASFVGHERIRGRLGERTGSFVVQHVGTFEGGTALETLSILTGSGDGQLIGLVGGGVVETRHAERHPMTLHYDFE